LGSFGIFVNLMRLALAWRSWSVRPQVFDDTFGYKTALRYGRCAAATKERGIDYMSICESTER